ncbi:hypothetical protein DFR70_102888 [Nocardia tenerifensis]|uniref:Alpha/beta hydrolase n=1 Tax=Nocardia tenerifensis TaxID=228006 RepID=A0A318KDP1_9NOCA|nr:hypothetical protein [Nocardia tenerifensis]PXX69200.1 hypothetical protein DFR70_102888 [Nocardia tenerifensis]
MATIVLVHGIAQEQAAADCLEAQWLPGLAGGVRNHGDNELADRLWRNGLPGDISTRMAFYGNQFLAKGAQGGGPGDLDDEQLALMEQLAEQWLATAAEHASDHRDRATAQRLIAVPPPDAKPQGAKAALRPALNALVRLRWFAPFGVGLAEKFVVRALSQVTRYFTDADIREYAQQQVLSHVGPDTRLIVAHSLGSVVAYEALHRVDQEVTLVTMGSPLGLRTVIYDRLRPQPSTVPKSVTSWHNLVDRDDLVAAHLDLAPYFPPYPGAAVTPVTEEPLDNGASPHDSTHYLTKAVTGGIVAKALAG